MLTVFARSVILFAFAVLAMRVMGKRQVGQLQPFEMVVVIMIADLAATPMGSVSVPLAYGILPMAALVMCHGLISAVCMKSRRFRRWMSGEPTVLVRRGVICEDALRRMSLTLDDLTEALRTGGTADVSQVEAAVLETGGQITVFPRAQARPVTPADLGLAPSEEGLPLPLIIDGEVQHGSLERAGTTPEWLEKQVQTLGFSSPREVFYAWLNGSGVLHAQGRGKTEVRMAQTEKRPGEVR